MGYSVVLLAMGIAPFVLIHVCIIGRTFGIISGRILLQENDDVAISRNGSMTREDIKKLPTYDFNLEERNKSFEMRIIKCVVCLKRLKIGERCKLLPDCNHSFHGECIDSWLIKTRVCPICRTFVNVGRSKS
ncbi:putative RING-H2 finger protein ATL61 [Rutidosis leptorrhynchoides]|uniref:putative RING-H2 finger protein ATL61 n=1 Tax=Rutidosis leptorrhynchoides TaxID=125765 RepID=UPI003A9A6224